MPIKVTIMIAYFEPHAGSDSSAAAIATVAMRRILALGVFSNLSILSNSIAMRPLFLEQSLRPEDQHYQKHDIPDQLLELPAAP